MKFSINYNSSLRSEAEEVRFPYNQLGIIIKFVKDNPDKRYLIEIPSTTISQEEFEKITKQIDFVKNITSNYTVACQNLSTYNTLSKLGYTSFISLPVSDWETFREFQKLGVSDIYIDGPLTFYNDVLASQKKYNLVRRNPTLSTNILTRSNDSAFAFIRPEDLRQYEDSTDIVFFNSPNLEREETLFNIYKRGSYLYDLKLLIPQLPHPARNPYVSEEFVKHRLNCKQRCKIPGASTCQLCDTELKLTNLVAKYYDLKENKK